MAQRYLPFFDSHFCSLECFSIDVSPWNLKFWDWNSFSSELNFALSNIINSSNLKTFSLKGIINVPITFFLHFVHLTKLELHSISPNNFRYDDSSSLTWAASKGVAPAPYHVVIDSCMWSLREDFEYRSRGMSFPLSACFPLIQEHKGPTRSMFLPFMCRLRFFEIFVDLGSATMHDFDILSFLMGSLCISLTSPATLERLKFNISFHDNTYNFDYYTFYEELRDADVWRHLDCITTHPTGSRLQRVDITVNWFGQYNNQFEPDKNEVLQIVLNGLPLLRSKDILFVEANSLGGCASYLPGITGPGGVL